MISIADLSKSYGKLKVLDGISCKFEPSKCYGISGANGAGKTTLFRCLVGLEGYTGEIKSDFEVLKNHVGFLPTSPYFINRMTGKEFLRLFCNARGIAAANLNEKNVFNLPLNQYAATYSTGMKKKLHLTAILIQDNDVFVLDEPFNGVDIQSNIIITDIINTLKERGKTVIMSSHILSTLRETCDEIYLLRKGSFSKHVIKGQFDSLENELVDPLEKPDLSVLGL